MFEVNKENGFFIMGSETETRNARYSNNMKVFKDLCDFFKKTKICNLIDAENSQLSSFSLIMLLRNSHADYQR